ncbi:MAG: fused response regulator/phosphatase [Gammaproteobacteria bacterium]|nr:fused response regulator/phosphatase [Gammaproteobacteria bacterium]MCW8986287.1 fused response regulator/phosphatase [Gammaproteobacteria bacterium]
MTKILVVDDIVTNRALLRQALVALNNYEVVEAVSGKEAIELFDKEKPDLILMDIMMPDMDGCEATTAIKEQMGGEHTPIIFVTALSSEDSLTTALESGGDDFISKPFNLEILASKINAHLRIRDLNQQLNLKNKLFMRVNQQLINEKELIEHFFESAIQQSFLDEKYIKYHMSSMSTFNGDLLLAQDAPHGGLYLIMGDFSGHGLTAAMGTLPVAMIFFKMACESAAVGDIAQEINAQLYKLMPPRMFFVATILELNRHGDVMTVWMGGNPEAYWFSKDGELKGMIHAQHMPLGILSEDEFDSTPQVLSVVKEDKIYLYSDGVTEAKNSDSEFFGDERLKETLVTAGDNRFEVVLNKLKEFTGEYNQSDDLTLVELSCHAIPAPKELAQSIIDEPVLDWRLSISFTADDMRAPNPVNKLTSILNAMPCLSRHKGVLHIILTEIYLNSLDHGILKIESIDKSDEEHFLEYYKHRDDALSVLKDASINFHFSFFSANNKHYLKIQVSDSGGGYHIDNSISTDEMLHGRGFSIIQSFSEKISFSDDGKTMEVLYHL